MAIERRINASQLDFDQIKSNLVAHMKATDSTFNDYNYEGSAMSTVIDVLAYITHVNSMNANFALNETFLDTSQLRSSVVSHAKLLGYTPRSIAPSVAYVNMTMAKGVATPFWNHDGSNTPLPLSMPRGTKFSTTIDSVLYPMFNSVTQTINYDATDGWKFSNIKLEQGTLSTINYTYQNNKFESYVIPAINVNTAAIKVTVTDSGATNAAKVYSLNKNMVTLDGTSETFFLEEGRDGYYEVKFGDNIIGKRPGNGNNIEIEYSTIAAGIDINGATTFVMTDSLNGNSDETVTLVTKATGGAPRETKESVKFNAPLAHISQNRAVTPDDYKAIIKNEFADVEAVSVWGGEDHDVPDYGKVYISIKPLSAEVLTAEQKTTIKTNILKPKNVVSITPVLVDPEYTYIDLEVFFKFNPNKATVTASGLATSIRNSLVAYNNDTLKSFGGVYRDSNVLKAIDDTNVAIISNITRIKMQKKIVPVLGTATKYELKFNQALTDIDATTGTTGSYVESTLFTFAGVDAKLKDYYDASSDTRIIQIVDTNNLVLSTNIGDVNEEAGTVTLTSFNPTALPTGSTTIDVTVKPASSDISPTRNELLTINTSTASITGEIDTMATGGTTAGIDYNTVSN
jgi:hypothetical protein|tara:strand:- start:782 stop:2665 length:1884 start_codon:yes stop_codon:yes gene_type:complete